MIVKEALDALSIDATVTMRGFYDILVGLNYHSDYDIAFLGVQYTDYDVDWLAYEFWSGNQNEPFHNFPNFANDSFDSWRDQLLHSTDYDAVYEAATEMQKILVYECPMIVCYENHMVLAYRTDVFEHFIPFQTNNWWTYYKVRRKPDFGGPFGGTIRVGNSPIDTLNFMVTSSAYSWEILHELYDSLLLLDPDGYDWNWLCEEYSIQTHDDNPGIPEGYTRICFDVIQNATWTDGTPLTGEDVAFTLNYYRDANGHPYRPELVDMTAAYAPTTYSVIVEFNSESFWHLHSIGYKPIIPEHVFADIGIDGWNQWDPRPPEEEMVTSGPFNVSDHIDGEFTELTRNDNYFYGIERSPEETTVPLYGFTSSLIAGSISAVAVIFIGGYFVLRKTSE